MIPTHSEGYYTSPDTLRSRGFVALLALALCLLLVTAGCSQPAHNDGVVAMVDDVELTQVDFDARLALYGVLFGSGVEEQLKAEETQQQILDELVEEILLIRIADERSIEPDPEQVEAEMAQLDEYLLSQFGDQESINEELKERGLPETAIHDFFKDRLLIQALYDDVTADIEVSDEEVQQYYEDNKQQFTIPEEIHAAHILVETEEEALALIDKLNGGEDFGELAKEHSLDETNADRGGDLGFFPRGTMLPAFEEAAFALEPGDITDEPVQTTYGCHIIRLVERNEARIPEFEEVKEQVHNQLLSEKRSTTFTEFIEELRSNADIQTSF